MVNRLGEPLTIRIFNGRKRTTILINLIGPIRTNIVLIASVRVCIAHLYWKSEIRSDRRCAGKSEGCR